MSKLTIQKPNASVEFKIQDSEFTVAYPTTGQIIDIAVLKAKLSENQYSFLAFQSSGEAHFALKLIDAFSFFSIMTPELKKKMAISLYDLQAEESLELINVYEKTVLPWQNQWAEYLENRMNEIQGNSSNGKRDLV